MTAMNRSRTGIFRILKRIEHFGSLFTDFKIQAQKDIRQLQDEILELKKKLDWKDSLSEEEKREGSENTTALRQEIDSLKAELATAYTGVRAMNTKLRVSEGLWKSVKGQCMAAEEKLERVEGEWSQLDRKVKVQKAENSALVDPNRTDRKSVV